MASGKLLPAARINEHYRRGELSPRAIRQRLIIKAMADAPLGLTRNAIAKQLVKELGLSPSNAYHYVFKELDESLIPSRIVEEAAHVKTGMGPKVLQEAGILAFRLSEVGRIVAASVEGIEFSKRVRIVEQYLISKAISCPDTFAVYEEALARLRKNYPAGLKLLEEGVIEFLQHRADHPMDLFLKS